MKNHYVLAALPALIALMFSASAAAQIKVGVNVSATGAGASLGIPEKNTFALLPKEIGGKKVDYIILDDASDSTTAVKNARKLVSEDKVDLLIGSTIVPTSLAMIDVAAETETPMISMAAAASIISPSDAKRHWIFKTPQNDSHMSTAVISHMADAGIKTVGFIGFSDAYGEGWYKEFSKLAELRKIKIVANERFARPDTSVTGQILKIIASNPDAVFIAGAGTPAALPQKTLKERGYKGKIYQTHGVANNDFLRVCGKDCEGTWLPAGPLLVADQLPADNPVKKSALRYTGVYEKTYGSGSVSTFGGHAWDAGLLLENAVPAALKKAQPGTKEFRAALRAAIENTTNLPVSHGIVNMNSADHVGLDQRSRVMVQIVGGKWKLAGQAK
ncbi:ABC transporter substrate-binding protein [Undibacterium sp. FT147W]|uniref:ABC transporter substrate-binding protein n=1 Tax=Undibacterium rivi TaxID=2828729 RepID=A0ABS5H7L3_9BURK|nr:ABC transporter substrate-binding protein [Undibacterium rivi]MBR7794074.1 ABC transporter substrate-binding protein [Undibacterium rivi]